jgi:hypothetical protein
LGFVLGFVLAASFVGPERVLLAMFDTWRARAREARADEEAAFALRYLLRHETCDRACPHP